MSQKVPYCWLILISLVLLALVGLELTDKILMEAKQQEENSKGEQIQVEVENVPASSAAAAGYPQPSNGIIGVDDDGQQKDEKRSGVNITSFKSISDFQHFQVLPKPKFSSSFYKNDFKLASLEELKSGRIGLPYHEGFSSKLMANSNPIPKPKPKFGRFRGRRSNDEVESQPKFRFQPSRTRTILPISHESHQPWQDEFDYNGYLADDATMKKSVLERIKRAGSNSTAGNSTDTDTGFEQAPGDDGPKRICNPIPKRGQRPSADYIPGLPPCNPKPKPDIERIPTYFKGLLEYGAPNCWMNPRIAEECGKGVEEYPPDKDDINAGVKRKTEILDKNACNWSKRLECRENDGDGQTSCGCMARFSVEIEGKCYVPDDEGCGGPVGNPLPSCKLANTDLNPIMLECSPGSECVTSASAPGRICMKKGTKNGQGQITGKKRIKKESNSSKNVKIGIFTMCLCLIFISWSSNYELIF